MAEQESNDKWLTKAQESYISSTTYMNISQRQQWENNIRMYNNEHPKGSKYLTEWYAKRSTIFRPKTRSAAMKFEARVSNAYFATADLVDIIPTNEEDPVQVGAAKVTKRLLNYRLEKTIPWFFTLMGAAQEAWKMGAVCSYQHWKFEKNADGKIIKDEPCVDIIPLENIRIDPNADWIDPIKNSPYVIRMIPMYVYEVLERIKQGSDEKTKKQPWKDVTAENLLVAKLTDIESIRMAREGQNRPDPKQEKSVITEYDTVWVHENIMRDNGKDYVYFTLGTVQMLSDPVPIEDVYLHGERPFVIGSILVEPFKSFKSGIPQLGQPLQEEANNIANDRLDNVKLVLNKRYFAKRGKNVDYKSLLRNTAGSITLMDDVTDVEVISTPDITSSSYAEQDRLNVDYDEIVGNFSSGSVQTNRKMNETVGGMGMIAQGAGEIAEYLLRVFNESWTEKVIAQLIKLEHHYEDDANVLLIAIGKEERGQQYSEYIEKLHSSKLANDMLVRVNVGITSTNPQFKVEKFMFAMDALSKIITTPMVDMIEIEEVVAEIFGLLGYRDGLRFFKSMKDNEDPRIQELQKQIQQLTSIIESKQVEQEAKYKIDREKLQFEIQKFEVQVAEIQANVEMLTAKSQAILADMEKTQIESQRLLNGTDDNLKIEEIKRDYAKIRADQEAKYMENKTKRDIAVAEWEKKREELEQTLKITLANAGVKPKKESNKPKEKGENETK